MGKNLLMVSRRSAMDWARYEIWSLIWPPVYHSANLMRVAINRSTI